MWAGSAGLKFWFVTLAAVSPTPDSPAAVDAHPTIRWSTANPAGETAAHRGRSLASNATVVSGDAQLFRIYPTVSTKTLLTFQLTPGAVLTVIPRDSRVEVSARKVVGGQEWFETAYLDGGATRYIGWMYAGDVGNRAFLRLDPGVEGRIRTVSRTTAPAGAAVRTALAFLISPAPLGAQQLDPVEPPRIRTDPVRTLIFGAVNLALFLGAMWFTKTWVFPQSNAYTFLTSFTVLLILGLVEKTQWQDLIVQSLTRR